MGQHFDPQQIAQTLHDWGALGLLIAYILVEKLRIANKREMVDVSTQEAVTKEFSRLARKVERMQGEIDKLLHRVEELEDERDGLKDTVTERDQTIANLKLKIEKLEKTPGP